MLAWWEGVGVQNYSVVFRQDEIDEIKGAVERFKADGQVDEGFMERFEGRVGELEP